MRLFVLLFLVSCSNLRDIDRPICVELSISKGYCTTIISGEGLVVDEENRLEGKTWFEMRPEMVLVPVSTWAALKKYLINNCKRSKSCNANIDSWNRSIEIIDSELLKKSSKEEPSPTNNSLSSPK